MKHRSRWTFMGLPAILLVVTCTTNPVTVENFNADRALLPDGAIMLGLTLVPGGAQVANGEYWEAGAIAGTFAGSVAAVSFGFQPDHPGSSNYVPKPGYDALALVGVLGLVGSVAYNITDAITTSMQRQAQYSAILADPRVLSKLVALEKRDAAPLYAIRYASYGSTPSYVVRLRNLGESKLRQIEVYAEGSYLSGTDQPVARVPELAGKSTVDIPVSLRFDPGVAALTEDRTVPLRLTASFRLAGTEQRTSTIGQVVILGRNAVDWGTPAALASSVQPQDPPIREFARGIGSRVSEMGGSPSDPSFTLQVLVAALNARGLAWFPDPLTPFAETSKATGRADYLQLPRESLHFLGGDSDEISILLSAVCEAAGLETALLFRPGTILTAVRLGPASPFAGDLRSIGGDAAREWAVLDPSRMPTDLRTLIQAGAQRMDRDGLSGLTVVRVRSAWGAYPPAVLSDTAWRADVPSAPALRQIVDSP